VKVPRRVTDEGNGNNRKEKGAYFILKGRGRERFFRKGCKERGRLARSDRGQISREKRRREVFTLIKNIDYYRKREVSFFRLGYGSGGDTSRFLKERNQVR